MAEYGLIKKCDYFEMNLSWSGESITGIPSQLTAVLASHYQTTLDDYGVGLYLSLDLDRLGNYTLEAGIGPAVLWSDTVNGDLTCRLYGNWYADETDYFNFGHLFEVYKDGVLEHSEVLADLDTTALGAKFPSYLPLIGIPPEVDVYGLTQGGSVTAVVKHGWRWVVDGVPEPLPTRLTIQPVPDPVGCPYSVPDLPGNTTADTWDQTVTVDVTNPAVVNDSSQRAKLLSVPDLLRRWRRIGDRSAALVHRFATPKAEKLSRDACNQDDVVTQNDLVVVQIPERSFTRSTVTEAAHPFEDALNDVAECLYQVGATQVVAVVNGHEQISQYTGAYPAPSGDVGGLDSGHEKSRYWNYLCNPHWSHKMFFDDWEVFGGAEDCDFYWSPIRSQWIDDPVLPTEPINERLKTRNNIVLDALRSCTGFHTVYYGHGLRQIGASRWTTYNVEPLAEFEYSSSQSSLFTPEDCSLTFGATILVNPSAGVCNIFLSLADWGVEPCMWPQIADQLKLDWVATNIVAVKAFLVGFEDSEIEVPITKDTWTDLPRGTSTKFAGSWAIDNGAGEVTDLGADTDADGISSTIMADPATAGAFQLLPGSTRKELRIEVEVADHTVDVEIEYPFLRRDDGRDPALVWESGQCAMLLYPDGSGIRFGNEEWWDDFGSVMLTEPLVRGLGYQSTMLDALAWARVWLLGLAPTDGLDAQIATLLDTVEGQTREDAAVRTAGVILPGPTWERVQIALMNLYSEIDPMALMPRRERDSDWEETGEWCLDLWSMTPNFQRYVCPGSLPYHLFDDDDRWTDPVAAPVAGWAESDHSREVDNSEGNLVVNFDGKDLAEATPWHGYMAVLHEPAEQFDDLHATGRDPEGFVYVLATKEGEKLTLVRTGSWFTDDQWDVFTGDVSSGQVAVLATGGIYVVYADNADGNIKLLESNRGAEAFWKVPVTIAAGTRCAVCTDGPNGHGTTWVAVFDGTDTWDCYRKSDPNGSFSSVGTIVTGVGDAGAGIEFDHGPIERLVFTYFDGAGDIAFLYSSDEGGTWA